jgi:3-deoxy-D-manno-octulosonic-acid transferase
VTRTLYTFLTCLLLPLFFVRLLWRARKSPAYLQRWGERLAFYPQMPATDGPCVVFHAVSVGEVHAVQPLIEALLQQRPKLHIIVTCTTPTGSARVQTLFGVRVAHIYLPYDLPGVIRRFLDHCRPCTLVLLETELWPNLLHQCHVRGIKVLLANARLSARSAARYAKHAALTREMLGNLYAVAAQAEADGERFVTLGLPRARLQVNGSLKFDVAIDAGKTAAALALKQQWQDRPVWIAASTREGEDAKVLRAQQWLLQRIPELLLLLVPRHPERFDSAVAQAVALGLQVQRYSSGQPLAAQTQVLVGDTMGEMYFFYGLAEIAFVGGSLVDTGCQNLIEPAALGLPVLSGPSLYNFQAVSELLCESNGLTVVPDENVLAFEVLALLRDAPRRRQMGEQALAMVHSNQGATARLTQAVLQTLVVGCVGAGRRGSTAYRHPGEGRDPVL